MTVYLIGAGCGAGTLTRDAQEAIASADVVLGAGRLLREHAPDRPCMEAVTSEAVIQGFRDSGAETACVLLSGDSGFYSGAKTLLTLLDEAEVKVLPGVSSLQAFAARLGRPWQDWTLCSAHGVACDPVAAVCGGKPVFFLTGGKTGPAELCRELCAAGLGELPVAVGMQLGTGEEEILQGTASELAERDYPPLTVMLAEAAPRPTHRAPGLPDDCFRRAEGVPMTKQEVRALALGKLGVQDTDICWDIGAGTGSVAVELALQGRCVYGIERDRSALRVAEENRKVLGAWNLTLVEGEAPEALRDLPAPDAVFVGGSGGRIKEILLKVHEANPQARICVSAIALESVQTALETLEGLGYRTEVIQLAVSRGRKAGSLHMMMANNPVFLITGTAE